jgi:hypothetical protein
MAERSMPEDGYEAKLAEFNAKADKLVEAERVLVAQSRNDEAFRCDMLARYDAALEARDQAGIAAYQAEVKELNERYIARRAALTKVRAEYDALERQRPRRPRRSTSSLLRHGAGLIGAAFMLLGAGSVYEWMTSDYVSWVNAAVGAPMCLGGILLLRWSLKRAGT